MNARSGDERLPWLDEGSPAPVRPAARRARTPLLVLLGLFIASAIAVMAFLTGRSTAPVPATSELLAPMPSPVAPRRVATPVAPPTRVVATPTPIAAEARVAPAKPRATRPKLTRKATVRRSAARKAAQRRPRVAVHRNTPRARSVARAYAAPRRRAIWPARPFAGPRGRVIQIGAYYTSRQADAAWWRLARVYPYLATLPRMVTVSGPSRGRPRYYRVRLAAGSNRQARALCQELHRVGRGCTVS